MSTGSVNSVGAQSQQSTTGYDALRDVDMEDFLKLMITQLQNQDPMDPMDNQEMLEQIGQIRAIESNERLTETLEAVQLGQSMATASSLIGRTIDALTDNGQRVFGEVDRVSIEEGKAKLHVGDDAVSLVNVAAILAEGG
jgi:flagellar basal-body rod modification protein FlgD